MLGVAVGLGANDVVNLLLDHLGAEKKASRGAIYRPEEGTERIAGSTAG